MHDLLLPVLKLRPRPLHRHQPLDFLIVLGVVVVVGGADEGDVHAVGVDEAGAALADGPIVADGLNDLHFGHVIDVVLDPLLGRVFDSEQAFEHPGRVLIPLHHFLPQCTRLDQLRQCQK